MTVKQSDIRLFTARDLYGRRTVAVSAVVRNDDRKIIGKKLIGSIAVVGFFAEYQTYVAQLVNGESAEFESKAEAVDWLVGEFND